MVFDPVLRGRSPLQRGVPGVPCSIRFADRQCIGDLLRRPRQLRQAIVCGLPLFCDLSSALFVDLFESSNLDLTTLELNTTTLGFRSFTLTTLLIIDLALSRSFDC